MGVGVAPQSAALVVKADTPGAVTAVTPPPSPGFRGDFFAQQMTQQRDPVPTLSAPPMPSIASASSLEIEEEAEPAAKPVAKKSSLTGRRPMASSKKPSMIKKVRRSFRPPTHNSSSEHTARARGERVPCPTRCRACG